MKIVRLLILWGMLGLSVWLWWLNYAPHPHRDRQGFIAHCLPNLGCEND